MANTKRNATSGRSKNAGASKAALDRGPNVELKVGLKGGLKAGQSNGSKPASHRAPSAIGADSERETSTVLPLTVHVSDPRAPEALTQAIHRALELSALSEAGYVVIHRSASDRTRGTSRKAKALSPAVGTDEAFLVKANGLRRSTAETGQGFDNRDASTGGPAVAHPLLAGAEELARHYRQLREQLEALGLVITSTMRVRDRRFGDRKVQVEYFQDPEIQGSVLMRLTPTTPLVPVDAPANPSRLPVEGLDCFVPRPQAHMGSSWKPMPNEATQATNPVAAVQSLREAPAAYSAQPVKTRRDDSPLIRTTEVAEMLGVSRPYITKLCDLGVFGPVLKTEGGQRRIPLAAVLVYQAQRSGQNELLNKMAASDTSARARAIDLQAAEEAASTQGLGWTKVDSSQASPRRRPAR